jgi:glycosyltransferase involved in cell wall biosynthesis
MNPVSGRAKDTHYNASPTVDVLLVYPYLPHPGVSHGSGRLLAPLLDAWRGRARVTLVCGYRPAEARHLDAARSLVHEMHAVPRPLRADLPAIGRAAETVRTAVRQLVRRDPIHVTKLDRRVFRDAIRAARARVRFDVAQIELAGLARCVAELDGLGTVLFDHEAGVASGGPLDSDPRSLRYVRAIYPRFSCVGTLCREDEADLLKALPGASTVVRRPGVAVPEPARVAPDARTVLFFGSPEHAPNRDALAWLATDLWPRIAKASQGARCAALGGVGSPRLAGLLASAGIEDRGFVADLGAALAAASVVVAPVRLGGGVRIKNLEALAAGRPLVTTKLGARGLDLENGRHAILADDPETFARAVAELLADPSRATRLGIEGRAHVARAFTHEAAAKTNLDLWDRLASGRNTT